MRTARTNGYRGGLLAVSAAISGSGMLVAAMGVEAGNRLGSGLDRDKTGAGPATDVLRDLSCKIAVEEFDAALEDRAVVIVSKWLNRELRCLMPGSISRS